jgi:predicted peptidase
MWMLITILLSLLSLLLQLSSPQNGQHSHRFERKVAKDVGGNYLLYLPQNYGREQKRYPLIMYLHGGSLRGDDVERLRTSGLPRIVDKDPSFPFIVVSPLCPAGEIWTDTDLLIGILDKVMSQYAVDSERIYLTGHSMGGRGALYLAYKYPDRFAAVVTISPHSTITAWAQRLKGIPIWIIHGAKDEFVPFGESESMAKALKDVGGDVKFTVLAERNHFILDSYGNKQLYEWFLEHRRKSKP